MADQTTLINKKQYTDQQPLTLTTNIGYQVSDRNIAHINAQYNQNDAPGSENRLITNLLVQALTLSILNLMTFPLKKIFGRSEEILNIHSLMVTGLNHCLLAIKETQIDYEKGLNLIIIAAKICT